jgi:AAA domain
VRLSVMWPSIGFLKSRNRTNVALSRAKHGLYVMGKANDLASQSPMWKTIIDILDKRGSLGTGFPISCANHPEEQHTISAPGMIPQYCPDGKDGLYSIGHDC